MAETGLRRAEEAERLLAEPLLQSILTELENEALSQLLVARGENADREREACAIQINVVRALRSKLEMAAVIAKAEAKPRGSVA